ncbi:hypothetical protein P3T39_005626 [Kitasatospora sp. GP82]|nr:hypothetical protein [Kitasatospora sp. GP82]MDH6128641.1 hypothetical protein [Kitasatospora sp. GP82]
MLDVEPVQEELPAAGVAPVPDQQSRTGLLTPPLGSFSTDRRMTVPSMIGSSSA